ncbi:MAG: lysine--tRNA ligase [Candidatus Gracilibacteria bacterium]|jgi:lysyl-tRNA synthetase class 2
MSSQEYQDRLRKAEELRKLDINPYPSRFESTHSIEAATKLGEKKTRTVDEILADKGPKSQVTIRGRLMTFREHGRLAFANLKDFTGTVQICFMEQIAPAAYKLLRKLDMGDFVGVSGELFYTKHGQLTVLVSEWSFLGKTLNPLPEKWHGIQDQEQIYRQRYLDLIMNEESMQRFLMRSRFIQLVREYLNGHGFVEVETPVLASTASGATARPFTTHHNALDIDVYLRIAPELYLKRCIAGGFERVYEFAKCFRNEGMDPSHLQEFTMLEYYAAYWNYEDNMNFTEEMLTHAIKELFGSTKVTIRSRDGEDRIVDFKAPWPRLDFGEMIKKDSGIDIYEHYDDAPALRAAIKAKKIQIDEMDSMGYGNLCDFLYKKVSRPKLVDPCFVINHPASTKPLARRSDKNPMVCETFQLLVNTWELINAYSEIVDPVDQKKRFEDQALARAGGDEEAMEVDLDYVNCMEHGMPPISGWGGGIDRIITLLTHQDNLRDCVLFPLMRPLEENVKAENKMREKAREKMKKAKKAEKK